MNIFESARQLGALRAVELACFARLGERAPELSPAGCARWAASASRAHAWRAGLLEDLLPVSVGLPGPAELTVVPGGALGEGLERYLPVARGALGSDPAGRDSRTDNGSGLVRGLVVGLYPLIAAEYRLGLDRCTQASDGAAARAMRRAAADLAELTAEGSALL